MSGEYGDIVYSFRKNSSEIFGAGFCNLGGQEYFYIRVFAASLDDPEAVTPTYKGITIPIDLLPEVSDGVAQIGDLMTNNKVVKRIPRGRRREIRIGVSSYRGNTYAYIRTFRLVEDCQDSDAADAYQPTQKGVSVAVSKYDELMKMLKTLSEAAG